MSFLKKLLNHTKSNTSPIADESYSDSKDYWICPTCGCKNPVTKISCKECGTYR